MVVVDNYTKIKLDKEDLIVFLEVLNLAKANLQTEDQVDLVEDLIGDIKKSI